MHQAEAELRRGPESRHGVVHRARDAIVVEVAPRRGYEAGSTFKTPTIP